MQLDHDGTVASTALGFVVAWTAMVGWIWNVRATAVQALRDGKTSAGILATEIKRVETAAASDLSDLITERDRDKISFEARLRQAELTSESVRELAAAVRHGGEMTAAQIKNLADRFTEHAADTKEQLSEVKEEQKNVRLALARRQAPSKPRAR